MLYNTAPLTGRSAGTLRTLKEQLETILEDKSLLPQELWRDLDTYHADVANYLEQAEESEHSGTEYTSIGGVTGCTHSD